jgi:ATP-dependent DNA helicase RecG
MHWDYSRASSYVAIAVFDDRIEVRSIGDFPTGIRAEMLSGDHPSILRNPLVASAFHRTGAVEVWDRGTNRVIEACLAHGISPPEFSEQAGVVTVTFRATVGPEAATTPSWPQASTKPALSRHQTQVLEIASVPRTLQELMEPSGRTDRTKFRDQVVRPLLEAGLLEMTIPDKPRSPRQRYRTTPAGARLVGGRERH